GLVDSKTQKAENDERVEKYLLVTRYDPIRADKGEMLKVDDVLEILSIPLLAVVPESQDVLKASNLGMPVTLGSPNSYAARAYTNAARKITGENVSVEIPQDTRGIFSKFFARKAA
ncbi:MAG: septum site-determining protein MinD, partial [Pseudomonadota bacterium]